MSRTLRLIFYGLFGLLVVGIIWSASLARNSGDEQWSISAVAEAAKEGRIERISVMQNTDRLHITLTDGRTISSTKDANGTATDLLGDLGVTSEQLSAIEWEYEMESDWAGVLTGLMYLLPLMVFFGGIVFLLRRAGRQNQPPAAKE